MPACPACGARTAEGARFCQSCGRPLVDAAPARDVRKTVTVLFADVTGSTALGERLDPEAVQDLLSRYFTEMRAVLERHGGTVEKFIGDAVMAVFGIPTLHEDDAMRAVRAAAEMGAALTALNDGFRRTHGVEVRIRTGVNTGEVVVGDLLGGQTFVTGDAVNVAARLEQTAAPGEIRIGDATHRLVRDAVTTEPIEPLRVRGREEPVRAYRLTAVDDEPAPARRPLRSPLVGRDREVAALQEAYELTVASEDCRLVTILGAPGEGKSRLVEEFLTRLGGKVSALTGRCLPYGEGITFWPIVEIVRSACGLAPGADAAEVRARLAARVRDEERADRIVEGVAGIIGVAGAAAPEETFWACRRFIEVMARERPLVLVLDDIHWAEPTLLDLCEYLADFADGPVLVICMSRPELLEARPGWTAGTADASTVSLDPLPEDQTGLLMANLMGQADIDGRLRKHVIEASEGNPLFVEEMVRMLIEEGGLRRADDGTWEAADDVLSLPVPPSISTLVAARLERMSPEERAVAQRAAVVGKVFYWGAVAALAPEPDRPAVGAHLRSLIRKEVITPDPSGFDGEDAFRFRHMLIQDAAYRSIPKEERADLHERFAGWMVARFGDRVAELEVILAHHLEQASRHLRDLGRDPERARRLAVAAAEHLAASGRRAFDRSDVPAAVTLLTRAAALLPEDHALYPALLSDRGEALMENGQLREASIALEEAAAAAASSGDRAARAHIGLLRLSLHLFTDPEGKSEAIRAEVERVVPVFEELGDERGLARAATLLAGVEWMACRYRAAEHHLERAIEHARRAGDLRTEMDGLARLAAAVVHGPTPAEGGIRRCREIHQRSAGSRRVEASVLAAEAQLRAMLGRIDGTREQIGRARDILEDLGLTFVSTGPSEALAFVEMLYDDPGAAERELRWGYERLEEMGERGWLSTAAAELGQAAYAQGRLEDAERFARISEENAASDDLASLVPARSVLAKVLARRGRIAEGEGLARTALADAERTDNLSMQADSLSDLAEVLATAGRSAEAADALLEASRKYEEKGNIVAARRALRTRERLAGTA